MYTIKEGILNALVCSAPNLQKLEIHHFGKKPFNWVFWISTLVKNPYGSLILVVNFGEVWRTQLAKSTLLPSTLVPLDLFRSFKVCSDAKKRVGCRKQQEVTAPIQFLVKLQPEFVVEYLPLAELLYRFLCLQWRTCPWAEQSDDDDDDDDDRYTGENHLILPEDQIYSPLLCSKISNFIFLN